MSEIIRTAVTRGLEGYVGRRIDREMMDSIAEDVERLVIEALTSKAREEPEVPRRCPGLPEGDHEGLTLKEGDHVRLTAIEAPSLVQRGIVSELIPETRTVVLHDGNRYSLRHWTVSVFECTCSLADSEEMTDHATNCDLSRLRRGEL